MSRQLLINNATAVPAAAAGVTNPDQVAEGRIAAFDADNFGAGTLDLTAASTADRVVFVQGAKEGEDALVSPVFNVEDIRASQLSERAFVEPTPQVTTVTVETGLGQAYVRVVQVNTGFKPHQRITVEAELEGKTAAEVATELANKINKARPNFVEASTDDDDLIITGNIGVSFETSLEAGDGVSGLGWNIAATAPNFGSGTSAQLREMEEVAYGGNFINRIYLPIPPVSYVEDKDYDLFTILIPTNTTANIARSNKYHELTLAVEDEATGIDLETFFGV